MSDFRIEDLFEPLDDPDTPELEPTPLDEAVMVHGFDNVYAALLEIAKKEEQR